MKTIPSADLSDLGPQDHLHFLLAQIVLGLLCFCDFLGLALKFLLLGINIFTSDGQLLLSLLKIKALLLGLLLGPSRGSFCTLPLPFNLSQLEDKVLTLFLGGCLGLKNKDLACFFILKLGMGMVHPFFNHMSCLDYLYKPKRTMDRVIER